MDAAEYLAALRANCDKGIEGACHILTRHGYEDRVHYDEV
jgi:hypothetical protein